MKQYMGSLMLSVVATAITSGTLAVMLNDIIRSYSLKGVEEGLMSSLVSAGAVTALLGTIILQGRVRKTQWIIGGGLLMSLMLMVKGASVPFGMFLTACFAMGLGLGVTDSCQSAFLADLTPSGSAKYMGALHGVFGIGSFLTPTILHRLLGVLPWRSVYILQGALCLVLILQFALATGTLGRQIPVAAYREQKFDRQSFERFFKNKYFLLLLCSLFFGAAGQSGVIVWTLRYVSVYLGSPAIATVSLSLFWVTSTLSRFAAPHLPLSPSRILAYGAFISAVAWGAAIGISTPLSVCFACCLAGLASGACMPMSLHEGATICPGSTGVPTSVLMIVKTVAQAVAPLAVAYAMSLWDMRNAMFVTAVFFALNGVAAFAIGSQQTTRKKRMGLFHP